MAFKSLKELSKEELKKREQQLKVGYVATLMLFVVSCQKFTFIGFVFLMLSFFILSKVEEIKKEFKSRT